MRREPVIRRIGRRGTRGETRVVAAPAIAATPRGLHAATLRSLALMKPYAFYRDGYNRTNLDFGIGPIRMRFSATDEPWDGPRLNWIIEIGQRRRRFVHFQISWSKT